MWIARPRFNCGQFGNRSFRGRTTISKMDGVSFEKRSVAFEMRRPVQRRGARVALHDAGMLFVAAHNRAVPIDTICAQLRRRGVFDPMAPRA
jgi:hypothetical protein